MKQFWIMASMGAVLVGLKETGNKNLELSFDDCSGESLGNPIMVAGVGGQRKSMTDRVQALNKSENQLAC